MPSNLRDGSLRYATDNLDIPMIVYEAGEALRFDEMAIKFGVRGVLKVMAYLEMLPGSYRTSAAKVPVALAKTTHWLRAPVSGMVVKAEPLGKRVKKGELLALLVDPLGNGRNVFICTLRRPYYW